MLSHKPDGGGGVGRFEGDVEGGRWGHSRWEFHLDVFEVTLPKDRTKGGLKMEMNH